MELFLFSSLLNRKSIQDYHNVLSFDYAAALQRLQQFSDAAKLEFSRYQRVILFNGAKFLQSRVDIRWSPSSPFVCFFNGGESRINPRGNDEGSSSSSNQETSKRNTLSGRRWTNVILAINVMYVFHSL